MRCGIVPRCLFVFLASAWSHTPTSLPLRAQEAALPVLLKIGGAVSTPLALTLEDLKKMPRKTAPVVNPHNNKTEVYEGVLVEDLLKKAGVPQGEDLRGPALTTYVVFGAEDGYRVVFSISELDSGILDSGVIVADTMDGAALAPKQGPLRVVAPHEKRPARWVRMLKTITVMRVSPS